MANKLLIEDWMLSELILNNGYTKEQLALSLQITLQELNTVLRCKVSNAIKIKYGEKFKAFYNTHHIKH